MSVVASFKGLRTTQILLCCQAGRAQRRWACNVIAKDLWDERICCSKCCFVKSHFCILLCMYVARFIMSLVLAPKLLARVVLSCHLCLFAVCSSRQPWTSLLMLTLQWVTKPSCTSIFKVGSMAISTGASTGPTTNDVKASSQLKAFSDGVCSRRAFFPAEFKFAEVRHASTSCWDSSGHILSRLVFLNDLHFVQSLFVYVFVYLLFNYQTRSILQDPWQRKSHPPVARQLFQEPEVEAQLPYQFFDRHSQSDIEFDSQVQSPSQLVPPPGPEIAAQPKNLFQEPYGRRQVLHWSNEVQGSAEEETSTMGWKFVDLQMGTLAPQMTFQILESYVILICVWKSM